MTPEQLHNSPDTIVVDIRKAPDDRMIPGSIRLDGKMLEEREPSPFDPDARVVLYCGSGNSCTRIATALRERGVNAEALEGGYAAWKEAGLPTDPIS
jgi:rhodanese-related sulfurtransferase